MIRRMTKEEMKTNKGTLIEGTLIREKISVNEDNTITVVFSNAQNSQDIKVYSNITTQQRLLLIDHLKTFGYIPSVGDTPKRIAKW